MKRINVTWNLHSLIKHTYSFQFIPSSLFGHFILSRRRSSCPVACRVTHAPVFNSFSAMIHVSAVNESSLFFLLLAILPPAIVPSLLTHPLQSSQHPMLSSNCTPGEMPWQTYGQTFFIFCFTCCRLMMITIDHLLLFIFAGCLCNVANLLALQTRGLF